MSLVCAAFGPSSHLRFYKGQMATPREIILTRLHARISALHATALRGGVLPKRVPADGLLILRDGEPEVTLSPLH